MSVNYSAFLKMANDSFSMSVKGYVYIMANEANDRLYVGSTRHLKQRIPNHKNGTGSRYAKDHNCNKLVYFKEYPTYLEAYRKERELKLKWDEIPKIKRDLVNQFNPEWKDLFPDVLSNPALD